MGTGKSVFLGALLMAALVGGWCLANTLMVVFLDLQQAPHAWNMWWQYVQAMNLPQFAPYVLPIKAACVIGFGLPLVGWFGVLMLLPMDQPEPLIPKRKPAARRAPNPVTPHDEEDEAMKLKQIAAAAALAAGTAACHPALAGTDGANQTVHVQKAGVSPAHSMKQAKAVLGDEYKKIGTYFEFRKKLIADGWIPVINPDCHDAILGNAYDDLCKDGSYSSVSCKICELMPEIVRSTSDGYNVMHYTKNGTPLSVTAYGDFRGMVEPKVYGSDLVATGWEYSTTINAFLIDE